MEKQNLFQVTILQSTAAIDRSKGEIEVHPDIWLPNQQAYTNDLVPKGTLKLSSKALRRKPRLLCFSTVCEKNEHYCN